MASSNDVHSGRIFGDDQNMGVCGTNQIVPRTVVDAMDQRLRWVEQLVEDLIGHYDTMAINTNKDRIKDGGRRGLREEYGYPIN